MGHVVRRQPLEDQLMYTGGRAASFSSGRTGSSCLPCFFCCRSRPILKVRGQPGESIIREKPLSGEEPDQSKKLKMTSTHLVSKHKMTEQKRMGRWYFGGLASAGAACCTHPLDLIKVQLQTKKDGNIGAVAQAKIIIRSEGFLALYNGLSASLVRQLTYSTTRFAIYEVAKQSVSPNGEPIPFTSRLGSDSCASTTRSSRRCLPLTTLETTSSPISPPALARVQLP